MNILIVDDEPQYYDEFRAIIENSRKEDVLTFVLDAQEAYKKLNKTTGHPYDVMILDEQMGGGDKDGIELLFLLRDKPIRKLPTIIYITGFYYEMPVSRIGMAGIPISLFLDKTTNSGELLPRALSLVGRQKYSGLPYHPTKLFGDKFIEFVLNDIERVDMTTHLGYFSYDQQKIVGTLIRSFFTTLKMRENWDTNDVLELSLFLTEGLCRIYDLPDDLIQLIRRFFSVEEVLYTIPRYRDHFLHQFKVFLLGFSIINMLNRNRLIDGTILSGKDAMKLWFLSSAFHDIGYPFEKIKIWLNSFIEGLLRSPKETSKEAEQLIPMNFQWGALFGHCYHLHHFERIINHLCGSYLDNSNCSPEDEVVKRTELGYELAKHIVEKPDHGLFSSLILQNILRYRLSDNEVDLIAAAVALHSVTISKLARRVFAGQLNFNNHPISFLLSYCDTAQDWQRFSLQKNDDNCLFGDTIFDNIVLFDNIKNEVCIELRYGRDFSEQETKEWKMIVFEEILQPLRNIWSSSPKSFGYPCFSIAYFNGSNRDNRVYLDKITF